MASLPYTCPIIARSRSGILVSGCCLLLLLVYTFHGYQRSAVWPSSPAQITLHGSRHAYATFLCSRFESALPIEEDPYFVATRVLLYQLLYHPETKTKQDIPFVVVLPPHVPEKVQQALSAEGAMVRRVEDLTPQTWTPAPANSRWIDQFTKLRLFEKLTDFDRVLYLDSDMLITKPLDGIFESDQVRQDFTTGNQPEFLKPDEAPLPTSYLLAAAADQEGAEGTRPKPITSSSVLNGGFFVFKPSAELFTYYVSVLELGQPNARFQTEMMEMGLLNYAHRRAGGNMPWTPLEPGRWNANWPSWRDYEQGVASLHDKFWDPANVAWIDRRLVEMWWRVRGEMDGFWLAKGKVKGKGNG